MPKKMGVNSKSEAARARRSATESDRKERETKDKEDQYWREAEGAKPRAAKKREEEAEKRAEANARKAEARRLAELEEKELEKSLKKPDKKANRVSVPVPKVTEAELSRRKEEEKAAMQRRAEEDKRKQSRTAAEEEYERMVSVENTNRDDSIIEARSVDEALARITLVDNLPVDKHPEKRLKASFKAFEEAELPKLKEEKPGLTHTQYKDMIWKLWKKSPDNPLNQGVIMEFELAMEYANFGFISSCFVYLLCPDHAQVVPYTFEVFHSCREAVGASFHEKPDTFRLGLVDMSCCFISVGATDINTRIAEKECSLADFEADSEIWSWIVSTRVILLQWDVRFSQKSCLRVMDGSLRMSRGILGRLGSRGGSRRRIIVGLKSDTCSREMLLRLLQLVVSRGDTVLAVHVQHHSDDTFDANTFHIYEDICKSKQVDFEVKICSGSCYIAELTHQVRVTFATILAVGCSGSCPEGSTVTKCLKALPPTCKLLIMDSGGRILLQQMGTSQQGSSSRVCRAFVSSLSDSSSSDPHLSRPQVRKSWSLPSSSTTSTSDQAESGNSVTIAKINSLQPHDFSPIFFQRSVVLEEKVYDRSFSYEELNHATENFGTHMLSGEGANSRLYKAVLENGQAASVKVLRASQDAEEIFLREVELLSGLKHEYTAELVGYCYCKEMCAVVYNFCDSSLKQKLNQLKWNERKQVALGVAKALDYLHSCHPPIIHTDLNSSNILLEDGRPQLSDFGAAIVHLSANRSSSHRKPTHVVETLRYLAPEYITYGKVDEKVDVYAYGILLLELITGKEATRTSQASKQESLLLWARSLLTCGLYERLIDPSLNEDYNNDEMKAMMIIARLCLLHSSSRRPTMKTILQFLEEPNYVLEIQRKSGDLPIQMVPEDENDFIRLAKSDSGDVAYR
ncbi:coiled-coil protein [Perilla frutescens var. hirtella]|nr:coiled-coil protein [Perilla frutescens var. frutescens]KAH6787923.1 coiled-coil protein [Perilla frutescens var. hirtella]